MVPLLIRCGRGELCDPHMPRVQWGDQPLDAAALAAGVPALEDHAHRRTERVRLTDQATTDQAELEQPSLREREPLGLLIRGQPQREIDLIKNTHDRQP
jgi:hypothetical protein